MSMKADIPLLMSISSIISRFLTAAAADAAAAS